MKESITKPAIKSRTSTSFRTSTEQKVDSKPPAGAKIIEQTIRTETEEIENGYIISKTWDGRYKEPGSKDDYGRSFYYTKKWYSKEDPLTITLNNKSLGEAFDE